MSSPLDNLIKRYFGHFKVRRLLASAFFLMLVLSTIVTSYLLYNSGNEIVHDAMIDLADRTSNDTLKEVHRFLGAPDGFNNYTARIIQAELADIKDPDSYTRLLWSFFDTQKQSSISAIYFTNSDAVFAGLVRESTQGHGEEWEIAIASPQTDWVSTNYAASADGSKTTKILERDRYIATERPWYEAAVKSPENPVWTGVYMDFDGKHSTITRAAAVHDDEGRLLGVAGSDLYLDDLQSFLNTVPISEHSELYIADENGMLLAANGNAYEDLPAEFNIPVEDSALRFTAGSVKYLDDQAGGFKGLHDSGRAVERHVAIDGETGFLYAAPIADRYGLYWTMVLFIPESDYLESLYSQLGKLLLLLLLCLCIALAAIVGFLHLVSHPLLQLRNGANRIAEGQFDVKIDTDCENEIGDLSRAIDGMRIKIRDSFREVKLQRTRILTILNSITDGVVSLDDAANITYMNERAEKLTGVKFSDVEGLAFKEALLGTDERNLSSFGNVLLGRMSCDETNEGALTLKREGKDAIPVYCYLAPLCTEKGERYGWVLSFSDLSEELRLKSELVHSATHDSLTNLVHRGEFDKRLHRAIEHAQSNAIEHVFCYLDLDQFKVINDTCGHTAGDELLRQVAKMLQNEIAEHHTIARLGGDEFGVLLMNTDLHAASRIIRQIQEKIVAFRFYWESRAFVVSISAGLVSIGNSSGNMIEVMKNADSACFLAKNSGRNRIQIYSEDNAQISQRRSEMRWVEKIENALQGDQFELFAQAIEATVYEKNTGLHFEILLRMRDEEGNLVLPGQFMPAVERFSLASQVDRWVVRNTLDWLDANPGVFEPPGICSINLSGQSLGDKDFLTFIEEQLDQHAAPSSMICFEVTETATIANLSTALVLIESLRARGCLFALDDFGSGLSSFAYLKTLPVDYLKIDGMFVRDMLDDHLDLAMVRSINEVGQTMGMKTIAEFVENDELRSKLKVMGIDYVQGYGVGKPMPLGSYPITTNDRLRSGE